MNIKLTRLILFILLLFLMIMIFNFSNQNAENSSSLSQAITEFFIEKINSITGIIEEDNIKEINSLETIIRKAAHFTIYTALGILLIGIHYTYKISNKKKIIQSILIGSIYGITDEIHQYFIPGRSIQISDIFLDSTGVIVGVLIVFIILEKTNNTKEKKIT